ncbi:MAG: hypothetical protein MJ001_01980, partial [Paludibacteraceae bacterium]|nr:hypothetical protein [Paludibacteraceae bacterium]
MDNNTILEIRQRSAELMRQALLIWQSGVHSENLEGTDSDPVFQMLMTAMAYQFNEMDSNLESIRQQVMDDFAEVLMPYRVNGVVPSSFVMQCQPSGDLADVTLDSDSVFTAKGTDLQFIPLLRTRVLNASVDKVVRIDGRRWKVSLLFPESVTTLDGFAFAISDLIFRDLSLTVNGHPLPLIKPWDIHNMPMTEPFDFVTQLYNRTPVFDAGSLPMDVMARQDVCLFCVGKGTGGTLSLPEETHNLDFIFEFFGIDDDFVLDKTKLTLNANILVNAKVNVASLSEKSPIARISDTDGQKFMKLLTPPKDQILSQYNVTVRRVMAERFNLSGLVRLLDCLIAKFHSDTYAFLAFGQQEGDSALNSLMQLMTRLRNQAAAGNRDVSKADRQGLYLFLSAADDKVVHLSGSFDIRYLTTNGAIDESQLSANTLFTMPVGVDAQQFRMISVPVLGSDGRLAGKEGDAEVAYWVSSSDRIVTPADIRMFCIATLMEMLSVDRDMVRSVNVSRMLSPDSPVGYAVSVEVRLVDSSLMRKTVGDRIPRLECLLENLLRVRSIGIYPMNVKIEMN